VSSLSLARTWTTAWFATLVLATGTVRAAEVVKVGLQRTSGSVPLLVARADDLFAAEGLAVDFVDVGPGSRSIAALAGGSVHIAPAATLSVLQAAEQGLDLVIVGAGSFMRADDVVVNGLVVRSDSSVRSAADLRGRAIGISTLRSINHLMTLAFLARGGVRPDEVTWQELDFRHMPAALERGQVEAASIMEPFLTVLRDAGRVRMLAPGQGDLPPVSMACYVALRSWAATHGPELRAFSRAHARGVESTRRNPGRVRRILVEETGLDPALAPRVGLLDFRESLGREDVLPLVRLARQHGLLAREPELDRLLLRVDQ
jgi:NitT/TauT family transport system substrate-binding protein